MMRKRRHRSDAVATKTRMPRAALLLLLVLTAALLTSHVAIARETTTTTTEDRDVRVKEEDGRGWSRRRTLGVLRDEEEGRGLWPGVVASIEPDEDDPSTTTTKDEQALILLQDRFGIADAEPSSSAGARGEKGYEGQSSAIETAVRRTHKKEGRRKLLKRRQKQQKQRQKEQQKERQKERWHQRGGKAGKAGKADKSGKGSKRYYYYDDDDDDDDDYYGFNKNIKANHRPNKKKGGKRPNAMRPPKRPNNNGGGMRPPTNFVRPPNGNNSNNNKRNCPGRNSPYRTCLLRARDGRDVDASERNNWGGSRPSQYSAQQEVGEIVHDYRRPYLGYDEEMDAGVMHLALLQDDFSSNGKVDCDAVTEMEELILTYLADNVGGRTYEPACVQVADVEYGYGIAGGEVIMRQRPDDADIKEHETRRAVEVTGSAEAMMEPRRRKKRVGGVLRKKMKEKEGDATSERHGGNNGRRNAVESTVLELKITYVLQSGGNKRNNDLRGGGEGRHGGNNMKNGGNNRPNQGGGTRGGCSLLDQALCCSQSATDVDGSPGRYCRSIGCDRRCETGRGGSTKNVVFDRAVRRMTSFDPKEIRAHLDARDAGRAASCAANRYAFETFGAPTLMCYELVEDEDCYENDDLLPEVTPMRGGCIDDPTIYPTGIPTVVPTAVPTAIPTATPTVNPTMIPTMEPTAEEDERGSSGKGDGEKGSGKGDLRASEDTDDPTIYPTGIPTVQPTVVPTAIPTAIPTLAPTVQPTMMPTPCGEERDKCDKDSDCCEGYECSDHRGCREESSSR